MAYIISPKSYWIASTYVFPCVLFYKWFYFQSIASALAPFCLLSYFILAQELIACHAVFHSAGRSWKWSLIECCGILWLLYLEAMGNTYLSIILNVRAYLQAVGIAYLGIILNVRASHGQWHLNWWLFFIICCFQFRCALLAIQSIYIAKKSQPLCLSTDYGCYFYWYHIIHSTFCCGSVMKIYCSLFLEIFFCWKQKLWCLFLQGQLEFRTRWY
jgi:hypothetical protein